MDPCGGHTSQDQNILDNLELSQKQTTKPTSNYLHISTNHNQVNTSGTSGKEQMQNASNEIAKL